MQGTIRFGLINPGWSCCMAGRVEPTGAALLGQVPAEVAGWPVAPAVAGRAGQRQPSPGGGVRSVAGLPPAGQAGGRRAPRVGELVARAVAEPPRGGCGRGAGAGGRPGCGWRRGACGCGGVWASAGRDYAGGRCGRGWSEGCGRGNGCCWWGIWAWRSASIDRGAHAPWGLGLGCVVAAPSAETYRLRRHGCRSHTRRMAATRRP